VCVCVYIYIYIYIYICNMLSSTKPVRATWDCSRVACTRTVICVHIFADRVAKGEVLVQHSSKEFQIVDEGKSGDRKSLLNWPHNLAIRNGALWFPVWQSNWLPAFFRRFCVCVCVCVCRLASCCLYTNFQNTDECQYSRDASLLVVFAV
jgi:hypothetical protein